MPHTHTRAHALILATQIDLEPLSFMYGGGIRWWQRVLKIYTGMFNEHTSVTTLLGSRSGDSGTCTDTPCSLIDTLFFVCCVFLCEIERPRARARAGNLLSFKFLLPVSHALIASVVCYSFISFFSLLFFFPPLFFVCVYVNLIHDMTHIAAHFF